MAEAVLHPSIAAMLSLAANIAANHPRQGLCQLERLRAGGVSEQQIGPVVDIARHIRDEAGRMLDAAYDEKTEYGAGSSSGVPPPRTVLHPAAAAVC